MQREELRTRDPDSFVWLTCDHDIVQFVRDLPDVFEQVLTEWTCNAYLEYDPTSALDKAQPRESQERPMRQKLAILGMLLIALVASASATCYLAA